MNDTPVKNNSISILIVEDENIVALDMRYRLEAFGYTICAVVATGDAAVAASTKLEPDLILMDIQLKGSMDGIESARRIHVETKIPIVFVTAFTDDATLEQVKTSDAYGYIVKPYHERELRIAIELALSKHRYEQELRVAKEAAEASDKAKTRFLSNVSHELKTPLNSIIGFMDLAACAPDTEDVVEYIDLASRGARKLETIIDSILDYTKLEFGELAPINTEFELEQFLVDCWMPFTGDASAKGIAARMYIDPDLPLNITGDEGKLKIIVRNLIDNAVRDFTDVGHVLLSAERVTADTGRHCMSLRVSDTGSGIPPDLLSVAFALFTQMDDSTTRAAGGMGLGLPLAKSLSDLLQVHMECSSSPGSGTVFTLAVELPATSLPAWPSTGQDESRRIGLYGKPHAREELLRWAPRFGLDFIELGQNGEGLDRCEAVVADCEAFLDADPSLRASLNGIGNGCMVLLGERCGKDAFPDNKGYTRLTYPPSLGAILRSIDKALGRTQRIGQSNVGAGSKNGSLTSTESSGLKPPKGLSRDYGKLIRSARAEAAPSGAKSELEAMLSTLSDELSKEDWAGVERMVKTYHNHFSADGAAACAKLALAFSMDIRNGMGLEIDSVLATLNIRGS